MPLNLSSLNAPQQEAIRTIDGPVLVLAGAGTGKTTVVTYRIGWILQSGVQPEHILAVTFTNKAAREMKERIVRLLPNEKHSALTVATFHAFCGRLLRRYARRFGYTPSFGIADDGDQRDLIRQSLVELGNHSDELTVPRMQSWISAAKNKLYPPDDVRDDPSQEWADTIATVYASYSKRLHAMNLVDFDDMILLVARLLQQDEEARNELREQYQYILVDEYQDTNMAQAELLRQLAGERQNLCVVGDDDQSIYGWRGAEIDNILQFPQQYPGTKVIKLEQNYRSTEVILKTANTVIGGNRQRHAKELWSERGHGDVIRLHELPTEREEASFVARVVQELRFERKLEPKDIAVLYRSNALSRLPEEALRAKAIPYRVIGGQSFYERREIKDTLAYMRVLENERDEQALLRILNVPPRGIGTTTIEKLRLRREFSSSPMQRVLGEDQFLSVIPAATAESARGFLGCIRQARRIVAQPGKLSAKVYQYLKDIGYISGLPKIYKKRSEYLRRYENVQEFIHAIHEYEQRAADPSLRDFLERNSLSEAADQKEEENENAVTLMTVHAAKGLEFSLVVVVGMSHHTFPHHRSVLERMLDEERRLFYVAITRAKDLLILTRPRTRNTLQHGRMVEKRSLPSQFLAEVPSEFLTVNDNALFESAGTDGALDHLAMLKQRWAKKD